MTSTPNTSAPIQASNTSRQQATTATEKAGRRRAPTLWQISFVLVVLGLSARTLRYLLNFPLWGDEAFLAVNFLFRDFKGMIDPLLYGQIAPLGFLWAELAATRIAGSSSEWALRCVPYLSGVLALLLFWRFARRNFGPRVTLLAVGFLAAAYYPIRHGVEVKPYATDLLIGLLLTIIAWGLVRRPTSVGRWCVLIVLGAAAVWCSYPAIFVASGIASVLAWNVFRSRSRTVAAGWLAYVAVLAASFSAMLIFFAGPHSDSEAASQLRQIEMWTATFPPVGQPWKLPLWFLSVHTGNMLAYPVGGRNGGSTATFILVLIGCVTLWRHRRALLFLLLGPLPFNFIAAALHQYPYGGTARTSLFMAPAFCLLAAVGLLAIIKRCLPHPHHLRGLRIAAGVLGIIAVVCMVRDVCKPYKKVQYRECRRVVRTLAEQVDRRDRVIVFLSRTQVEHAPYIRTARGAGAQLFFYMNGLLPAEPAWAPPAEDIGPIDTGQTWLVVFRRERKGRSLFPEERLRAYLEVMTEQCGQPERQTFTLSDRSKDRQVIEVYRFARRGT